MYSPCFISSSNNDNALIISILIIFFLKMALPTLDKYCNCNLVYNLYFPLIHNVLCFRRRQDN